jgi:hypothetical protein
VIKTPKRERGLAREALFQAADLRRDVRFRYPEDRGYVAIAVLVQIEKQQGSIQRVEPIDERVQQASCFVGFGNRRIFDIVRFVERHGVARAHAVRANERDRDVQSDAVHPGREHARRIVGWKRAPELRNNLLRDVFSVGRIPAIRGSHLEDDSAMTLEQLGELRFSVDSRQRGRGQALLPCHCREVIRTCHEKITRSTPPRAAVRVAAAGHQSVQWCAVVEAPSW